MYLPKLEGYTEMEAMGWRGRPLDPPQNTLDRGQSNSQDGSRLDSQVTTGFSRTGVPEYRITIHSDEATPSYSHAAENVRASSFSPHPRSGDLPHEIELAHEPNRVGPGRRYQPWVPPQRIIDCSQSTSEDLRVLGSQSSVVFSRTGEPEHRITIYSDDADPSYRNAAESLRAASFISHPHPGGYLHAVELTRENKIAPEHKLAHGWVAELATLAPAAAKSAHEELRRKAGGIRDDRERLMVCAQLLEHLPPGAEVEAHQALMGLAKDVYCEIHRRALFRKFVEHAPLGTEAAVHKALREQASDMSCYIQKRVAYEHLAQHLPINDQIAAHADLRQKMADLSNVPNSQRGFRVLADNLPSGGEADALADLQRRGMQLRNDT